MRSPKPAKEDPNVVAAREREQRRAETARTEETQVYLQGATIRRNRRFGKVSNGGGSVPIYAGAPQLGLPAPGSPGLGSGGSVIAGGGSYTGGGSTAVLY